MKITLYTHEILADVREKSRQECQQITDVEARYRTEAGMDKDNEVYREIVSSAASLSSGLSRFIKYDAELEADNSLALNDSLVFLLDLSERRAIGKAQALADRMHDYIVHETLCRYYKSAGQGDMSNAHGGEANGALDELTRMLYSKREPQV